MVVWQLPPEVLSWITLLTCVLHQDVAWRLLPLLARALFAQGRKTVVSWLRGGQLGDDYKAHYYFLGSLSRKVNSVAFVLFRLAVRVVAPGPRRTR